MSDCRELLAELEKRIDQRFELERRAVDIAHLSADKRLDGMNEFRGALTDQAGTFITRKEFYTVVASVVTLALSAFVAALQFRRG